MSLVGFVLCACLVALPVVSVLVVCFDFLVYLLMSCYLLNCVFTVCAIALGSWRVVVFGCLTCVCRIGLDVCVFADLLFVDCYCY